MSENETDHPHTQVEQPKNNWQRMVILFNVATIVSTLSVVVFGSMLSNVSDDYQKLSDATTKAQKSMTELKESLNENAKAIQALYKRDSTKRAQFRLNKKKISNRKQEDPIVVADTTLYVDRRHHKGPQ